MSVYIPPHRRICKNAYNFPLSSKKSRMYKLLGGAPFAIKDKFKWDDEALWSFTHHNISDKLCKYLLTLDGISTQSIITDAMSSVGGNTIPFAKFFKFVNAVEVNSVRKSMLDYNLRLYGLTNVKTYNNYYQSVSNKLEQDIVFFDPPWGIDYKKYAQGSMRICIKDASGSTISVENLVCKMVGKAKYCVVKLPKNYDFEYFANEIKHCGSIINTLSFRRPNSFVTKIIKML